MECRNILEYSCCILNIFFSVCNCDLEEYMVLNMKTGNGKVGPIEN